MTRRRWLMVLGALVLWSIPGLIQMGQEVYYASITGGSYGSLWRMGVWLVPRWWLWALAMPLVMWLARRWRPDGSNWRRVIPLHVLMALVLAAVIILLIILYGLNVRIWGQPAPFKGQIRMALFTMIPYVHFLAYWVICALTWIFDGEMRLRQRDLEAARLEAQFKGAQLDALRMQLQPHFLFNTLNSASVLMDDDVERARLVLQRLGVLLRRTLSSGDRNLVTVAEEIDTIRQYLDIEQIRFHDRLTVDLDVSEESRPMLVPVMILQPLVENALRHGIECKPGEGRLAVSVSMVDGRLALQVADDGVGLDPGQPEGVGLSNTRARLEQIYGPDHTFSMTADGDGGTVASISIPAQEASNDHA